MKNVKAEVIMLPTEKASSAVLNLAIPTNLYLTTDEEVKVGDWFYTNEKSWSIDKCLLNSLGIIGEKQLSPSPIPRNLCKKIVASTDESLKLPRPSNEFLKAYCEKGGIDQVLIEYNTSEEETGEIGHCDSELNHYIKVAPDNTITIHPVK